MILGSQPDLEVVGEGGDGAEVAGLVDALAPDVVVMDVRMARRRRGVGDAGVGRAARGGGARVLVLTTFDLDEAALSAIEAGASGFVLKSAEPELLLASIRAVASGTQVVAAGATRALVERFRAREAAPGPEYDALTPREREILRRTAQGLSNAEIAAARVPGGGHRQDACLAHVDQARAA